MHVRPYETGTYREHPPRTCAYERDMENGVCEGRENVVCEGRENVVCGGRENVVCDGRENVVCDGREIVVCGGREIVVCGGREIVVCGGREIVVCGGREIVVCGGREIGLNDNALSDIHFALQPQKNGTHACYSIGPQIRSKPARITCVPPAPGSPPQARNQAL